MHNRKAGQDRYICYLFIFKKEKGQKSLLHTTAFLNLYTESLLDRSTRI